MWNTEPYWPWKDGLWSWFRKWFSPVSEFCREPLDFIEVYDQNTHEKGEFGKDQYPTFMLKLYMFPCSHICHMLASILSFCLRGVLAVDASVISMSVFLRSQSRVKVTETLGQNYPQHKV